MVSENTKQAHLVGFYLPDDEYQALKTILEKKTDIGELSGHKNMSQLLRTIVKNAIKLEVE